MENIVNNISDCPSKYCKGKLRQHETEKKCVYDWAISMKCNACKITRYVCKICLKSPSNVRLGNKILLVRSYMWRHNNRHLKCGDLETKLDNMDDNELNNVKQNNCQLLGDRISENDSTTLTSELDDIPSGEKIPSNLVRTTDLKTCEEINNIYDNVHSYVYYKNNASANEEDSGPAFMIGKAIMGTMKAHRYMNKDDILLHLLLAKFTSTLTFEQRNQFCLILNIISKKDDHKKSTFSAKNKKRKSYNVDDMKQNDNLDESETIRRISTRYPLDEASIRRYYHVGPNSILQNLPSPNVTLIDNHAYVSLRQCIADFLGKGNHINGICQNAKDSQQFLTDSSIARKVNERAIACNRGISQDDLLVILGIQWSDDFEPNTSSKTNRGSVWVKTLTFLSNDFHKNRLKNTYAISLGLKSEDHDTVENMFVKESDDLSNGVNNTFYSMFLKRNIRVHFEIIASLGDQPERRSMNKMILGNSSFLSRFHYSANVKGIAKHLPPCVECLRLMRNVKEFDKSVINCQKCVNWNFLSDSNLLNYEAPKSYPANSKGKTINLRWKSHLKY